MSSPLNPIPHKTRRHHSEAFKSQVVQQCKQDRASVAGVALRFNVNANIVHRWLREHERHGLHSNPAFVPAAIDYPLTPTLPVPATVVNQHTDSVLSQNHNDIRVEIQRGQCAITVHWPTQASAACSAWLSEWLK
jgi:transposase-like protein